jgi:hypothetical protein
MLLALAAAPLAFACVYIVLRLPLESAATRLLASSLAAVAAMALAGLAFVPLALALRGLRFTVAPLSRPLAELEQVVYALATHEYTVVALLAAVPCFAILALVISGRARAGVPNAA